MTSARWKSVVIATMVAVAAVASLSAATTSTANAASPPPPLNVVATTGMIADAARRVGGGVVVVRALMGPGVDPHAYRQTRTDIAALTKADLVLWHGLYLEAQMEEFMATLAKRRTVVAVGEAVPKALLTSHPDYAGRYDPHVWMDPGRWKHVVGAVRDALAAARPEAAAVFDTNAASFLAEIEKLEAWARERLATVPESRRVLLTAHDAFGYLGAAFGLEVIGIQGISTESEAGLARIAELVDLLVGRGISAVFVESSVSDRNVRALVEGARARGHEVMIGGELYSDAMGPEGTYEGTWIGMIDHNVTVVTRALGGSADSGGMQGRLAPRSRG